MCRLVSVFTSTGSSLLDGSNFLGRSTQDGFNGWVS